MCVDSDPTTEVPERFALAILMRLITNIAGIIDRGSHPHCALWLQSPFAGHPHCARLCSKNVGKQRLQSGKQPGHVSRGRERSALRIRVLCASNLRSMAILNASAQSAGRRCRLSVRVTHVTEWSEALCYCVASVCIKLLNARIGSGFLALVRVGCSVGHRSG